MECQEGPELCGAHNVSEYLTDVRGVHVPETEEQTTPGGRQERYGTWSLEGREQKGTKVSLGEVKERMQRRGMTK